MYGRTAIRPYDLLITCYSLLITYCLQTNNPKCLYLTTAMQPRIINLLNTWRIFGKW